MKKRSELKLRIGRFGDVSWDDYSFGPLCYSFGPLWWYTAQGFKYRWARGDWVECTDQEWEEGR